jgi:hypothetical protein
MRSSWIAVAVIACLMVAGTALAVGAAGDLGGNAATAQYKPKKHCPQGYRFVDGSCIPNGPDGCPGGTTLDPATGTCKPNSGHPRCPDRYHWSPSRNTCVKEGQPKDTVDPLPDPKPGPVPPT